MITVQTETIASVKSEIGVLLRAHYDEIALHKDVIKLAVDWGRYEYLEQENALRVYTARDDGRLIGYSAFFLVWHPHYKNNLFAQNDVLYLSPEYRNGTTAGIRLIKYSEEQLLADRVDKIMWHVKTANDWSAILERLGYQFEERIMGKVL